MRRKTELNPGDLTPDEIRFLEILEENPVALLHPLTRAAERIITTGRGRIIRGKVRRQRKDKKNKQS